jgi:hypothetical protein
VTISGDGFQTPVNGDQLQDALFFEHMIALPPDLILRATRDAVIVLRRGAAYRCHRGDFIDVVRGLLPKLRAEVLI